jgi:rhodanese-related sulfurtransferase
VTPTPLANLPQTADDLQVISPELLKAMIEGGADIAIADAQPAEGYALGHIKGAVNLPWDMQIASPGGLPTDKLVVVYCACAPDEKPSGTDAGDVAMQLITRFGYTKIAVLDGGWVRWQQYGFPSATGQ